MPNIPIITLNKGRARPFWYGNPLIFSGAIAKVQGQPEAADSVLVKTAEGEELGWGVYNPHSQYRVRLLGWAQENIEKNDLTALIRHRLQHALSVRQALQLPSPTTDAFRLFNSEGDGLSGLTIDAFAGHFVVAASAYWVAHYRDRIQQTIREVLQPQSIHWRAIKKPLTQDGYTVTETEIESVCPFSIQEHGVQYQIDLNNQQKTGFYLDQRDNRLLLQSLAKGRRVLDAYCYSGGFALNAAAAGASYVCGVDSSAPAIALAQQNAELNKFTPIEFNAIDAMHFLQQSDDKFDIIILDPPKLAAQRKDLRRALQHYQTLNQAALKKLASGSLLMTFSCSAAVNQEEFNNMVRNAAFAANKRITFLKTLSAASCHPIHPAFPEGNYLTGLLVAVM